MPVCDECGKETKTESGLAKHVAAKHPPQVEGSVFEATTRSVESAKHLEDVDSGPVQVLLTLARTIDGMPQRDSGAPMDNVTIPTYLKYAKELGLTPVSRGLEVEEDGAESKLSKLRSSENVARLRSVSG